ARPTVLGIGKGQDALVVVGPPVGLVEPVLGDRAHLTVAHEHALHADAPRPMRSSAPGASSTVRESTIDAIANAMRDGTLALMRPVTTLTDGRCVASTRWMPTARAFWAILK